MRQIIFALAFSIATAAQAETLTVGTLNTESDSDTQPFKVAETIRGVGPVDVWAFQEVADIDAAVEFTVAAGAASNRKRYRYVISESGEIGQQHRRNDFLAIVYNASRLRQVETVELHGIRSKPGTGRLGKPDWHLRGALFVRLQDMTTGVEFYVGTVHLKCCGSGAGIRAHQAEIIREWISRADVPVILTGDFNIPVAPTSATGNQGSAAFTTLEQVATWLRPSNPVKTQCSPRFNSMLDLFFLTEGPNISISRVAVREVDPSYCDLDTKGYADHRPVVASFEILP